MLKRTLCIESPCHLRFQNGQLVVSYSHVKGMEEMPEKSVPIEDIGILVLEHQQITLTHFLLDKLSSNNTAVVTCNEQHMPSGLLMPLESHTLQSERFRFQIEATEPLKKQLWQQTIKAKIYNQAIVLNKWQIPNQLMINLAQKVKSGDSDNHEAQASAHYWKNIFPPAWQFFRHREGPPPNNLLNYGYAIIRATMARALAGSGLLPALGIFHRNRYNAYCLADDIMEPYRPFVDLTVRELVDKTSQLDVLNRDLKNQLLKLPTLDVKIEDEKSPLFVATQRTAASLAKCLIGQQRKIAYPVLT
ncbi:type II CRISPR-associated endonuclease Cas1 [Sediminibacterium sp. C3]|uniref:type II CRISPR-associated endonuclease Cas1 n=1 Tax=Sediminibacterium sp. C3 TaxID=1267211 RepID=UPI0004143D97|nr:type II CRISPR-associated endonuclease Cas1 [Sediminibacterium sp. C3]